MISITEYVQSVLEKGKRIAQVIVSGKGNTQNALESGPFGIDSQPPKGMRSIFAKTANQSTKVVIGYINENQIAKEGEFRIYSIDSDRNVVMSLHMKSDGTAEFNGNADNMVRFISLKNGLQSQDSSINIEFQKIAVVLNGLVPGSYTPATISTNIDASKIAAIKTSASN